MNPNEEAYQIALKWYEVTNSRDEALQLIETKRKEFWRPSDFAMLDKVTFFLARLLGIGSKAQSIPSVGGES